MRFSFISSFVILALLVFSCRQTGNQTEVVEARFNVDQELLDSVPITDNDISFKMQYPQGWELMEESFRNQLAEHILAGKYAPARILSGAVHPVDSSMLLVLDVRQVDSSFFAELKQDYEIILNQDQLWMDVQLESFAHNCFIVDQYVLQNERLVQFRLQCRRKDSTAQQPVLEVYFFLNRSHINNNIKSVESSIGTLNCLN
jgi:hypothetical protein